MQIYIAEGAQQTGPFDLDAIKNGLRAGRYTPAQLAWYEGAPGWEPISRLPGLETFFAPPPPSPAYPPTPPAYSPAPPAAGAYSPAPSYAPPPSFIPVPSMPYVPGAGPAKRGFWGVVGSVVLGLVAVLFGLLRIAHMFWPHDASGSSHTSSSTPASISTPVSTPAGFWSKPAAPATPAAPSIATRGTRHFTTDRSIYSGNLAEHYVGFSFDYPEGWSLQENTQDTYVTLKHDLPGPGGKPVQAEFVTFTYAFNRPGYPMSKYLGVAGPQLLGMTVDPLMKEYPRSTKTPARAGRFGKFSSEEVRITNPTGVYYLLAIVASPNSNSTDGVGVTFISSDLAGNNSADTLGESGGLRTIRDSFRFEP